VVYVSIHQIAEPATIHSEPPSLIADPPDDPPPPPPPRTHQLLLRSGITNGISLGHEYRVWLTSSIRVSADSEMDLRVPSLSVAQTWQSEYQGYIPLKF